ncbi:hypothetical protein GGR57DRAFT_21347 [Xylariaceae sp. FL1272]|nr:hypothetical protein GGR57DRAFT_21347 [Xylariaceae sp. FL1272]
MSPRRKRAKQSPQSAVPSSSSPAPSPTVTSGPAMPSDSKQNPNNTRPSTPVPTEDQKTRTPKSWYGGSWPRPSKSSPSISIARETISGTPCQGPSADFSRFDTNKPQESSPCPDTPSTTPSATTLSNATEAQLEPQQSHTAGATTDDRDTTSAKEPFIFADGAVKPGTSSAEIQADATPANSAGWLSWIARSASQRPPQPAPAENSTAQIGQKEEEPTNFKPPEVMDETATPETSEPARPASSWFGFFTTNPSPTQNVEPAPTKDNINTESSATSKGDGDSNVTSAPKPQQLPAGTTWAFWSRDNTYARKKGEHSSHADGELAVMAKTAGDDSRGPIDVEVAEDSRKSEIVVRPVEESKGKKMREKPQSKNINESSTIRPTSQSESELQRQNKTSNNKVTPANLLLPSFKSTYHLKENPSIIQQITQVLLRIRQPPVNHVFLSRETHRVAKAIAIGVHGFFPHVFLRPMIGQPTGTSIRFANRCAEAIRRWTESHGSVDCEIERVALEGEGKIGDRVDNLWKLLLNWIEHIRHADLIVFACHSQGVPVSIMLLAKLIDLGVITTARIGVCAMAGVSLGPFPDYKSGMLRGSAAELWQFADPNGNEISQRYEHSLKAVIEYGARVTYIGSIDDQLVPMESALYGPASHPYIYRAVFIDGRIHAPDFIAHLVGFALKLRNLGVSDHGLIRELSVSLAGSLYTGEGHSRLYDEDQVYDLAISHTLETTSVAGAHCQIERHQGLNSANPYILPWIMRGLLEEEFVRTELTSETAELLRQFDAWTPTTKALKDVKYRLEAVRSKL